MSEDAMFCEDVFGALAQPVDPAHLEGLIKYMLFVRKRVRQAVVRAHAAMKLVVERQLRACPKMKPEVRAEAIKVATQKLADIKAIDLIAELRWCMERIYAAHDMAKLPLWLAYVQHARAEGASSAGATSSNTSQYESSIMPVSSQLRRSFTKLTKDLRIKVARVSDPMSKYKEFVQSKLKQPQPKGPGKEVRKEQRKARRAAERAEGRKKRKLEEDENGVSEHKEKVQAKPASFEVNSDFVGFAVGANEKQEAGNADNDRPPTQKKRKIVKEPPRPGSRKALRLEQRLEMKAKKREERTDKKKFRR